MKPCKKCGHILILGKTFIEFIQPHDEPYEADEFEEVADINCNISLLLHYCPNCKIIHDIWDDEEEHLIE